MPGSCFWTQAVTSREQIEVVVAKLGKGITVTYGLKQRSAITINQHPAQYIVELVNGWSISFGTQAMPTDMMLTQYLINITAAWDLSAQKYGMPWRFYLSA
jgi:hypothetical protein